MEKSKKQKGSDPMEKRRSLWRLLTVGAALLLLCAACSSPGEDRVFALEGEEITAITIQRQDTIRTFDRPEDIAGLTDRLNEITWLTREEQPAGGGWTYRMVLETADGPLDLVFGPSAIRMDGEGDRQVLYTLPEGAMQDFVDMVE